MSGGAVLAVFIAMVAAPGLIARYDPLQTDFPAALQGPSASHWFGTDELGRDVFARIVYGARVSFLIGIGGLALSAVTGTVVGLATGYSGGWVDDIVMRVMDILMSFPGILLAIAIAAGLGPGVRNVTLAIGIYSIPTFGRLVRAATLAIREQEFITGAKAIGASSLRIIVRHVLPNIFATTVLVQLILRFGLVILSAAGLGFLGLGVQPPQPEWGQMIGAGQAYLNRAPHLMLFAGGALAMAVLAFNLVGDWLQTQTDPYLRRG